MSERGDCCPGGECGPGPDRREFLSAATVAAFGVLQTRGVMQGKVGDHFVPADKRLDKRWVAGLTAPGPVPPWRGEQLRTVAMPCGGVAAGQLYVTGDGRLAQWWIANDACHSSFGGQTSIVTPTGEQGVCYGSFAAARPVQQGTLLAWRQGDGAAEVASLDAEEFNDTACLGEYPIATIDYDRRQRKAPLAVRAEVFSPFVPLAPRLSAMPCTLLRYTLHNRSDAPVTASLAVYLQNPVLQALRNEVKALVRNVAIGMDGFVGVAMDAIDTDPDAAGTDPGAIDVFADFEDGYGDWKVVSGSALGTQPAEGTLPDQQKVAGFEGKHLINTFKDGDDSQGVLVSPEFTIARPCILFRIGGGRDPQNLVLTLDLLDGGKAKTVRSATGKDTERLVESWWDVAEFQGKRARLSVQDRKTGPWGHLNVDYIRFSDLPPQRSRFTAAHAQAGDVALVAFDAGATALADVGSIAELRARLQAASPPAPAPGKRAPLSQPLLGAVANRVTLQPDERRTLTFAVTWCFPNRLQRDNEYLDPGQQCGTDGPRVGNMYGNWFRSALAVAEHLVEHGQDLTAQTFAFRDALYRQTTLPGWLVQRLAAPLSTMATATLQWWENGRVWGWEGVGCCPGTCGHVWNYAQGMAWLFPELERSVREHQDFHRGLGLKDDGAIGFRGTARNIWAGDAQAGYVLKAWREHRLSRDGAFLQRHWPAIKLALSFLVKEDGAEPDGLLEGKQHNTYDIEFYGGNTMVGSLYLGALRAGARMAKLQGDDAFAAQCEKLAARGAEVSMQRLWNGEFFAQQIPAEHKDEQYQYGDGCLSDQLLGQWFASQLGLGHLYPEDAVVKTLQSIWRYNWAPDIGPQAKAHRPERDFAKPGEAGLFTCTWPKSKHPGDKGVRYRDEVWTGIEYQVAAHMLSEGMITEGLAIVRGIHERYDGSKHNPYNEVECGDHYARAMASWSCLLALSGFECDMPAGVLGFAPKLTPEDFRCFFSAGTGWGTIAQQRADKTQTQTLWLQGGELQLGELRFQVPERLGVKRVELGSVVGDLARVADVPFEQQSRSVIVRPKQMLKVQAATRLVVTLHFA